MRSSIRSLSGVLVTLLSVSTWALQQPGGAPIPSDSKLRDYLSAEGESIEPATQAAITPTTFDPSCRLTFRVIARGGTQRNSFGWYNVTGNRPTPSELHEFLTCTDDVGTVKSLSVRGDPRYKGGRVGFFMATTEGKPTNCVKFDAQGPTPDTLGHLYFSERQYNDDNVGADSYLHLVVMDSGKYSKAFYFGWEDLFGGGDNDFEDLLTRVEGITCEGAGASCETGQKGICALGSRQCRNGSLACVPQSAARAEQCNGLDDDCDGDTDEAAPCPTNQVCHQGRCVSSCQGELVSCAAPKVCNAAGYCDDPACAGVTCPAGQRCEGGACRAPCEGVTCPSGQVCRVGQCVDPCQGLTCDADQVCDQGVCKDKCSCRPCAAGFACQADGRCVAQACANKTCGAGEVCGAGGQCVDACQGATCPAGQACRQGQCEAEPVTTGPETPPAGPSVPSGASDGGAPPDPSGEGAERVSGLGGCGCGATPLSQWPLGAAFLMLLGARRRARRAFRLCAGRGPVPS